MFGSPTLEVEFADFWYRYPRRVGKLATWKLYVKVRQSGVTQATLLDGVDRYIRTKPAWQEFCHPRTWINQGRWMDQEPEPTPKYSPEELRTLARRRAGL